MTRFVSLFRGINVGGNKPVRMDALKELHESLGLQRVETYIQSRNVVFTSEDAIPAQLSRQIEEAFVRSKLTNTFLEKKLKTMGTARNWNTVLRLQKMMER